REIIPRNELFSPTNIDGTRSRPDLFACTTVPSRKTSMTGPGQDSNDPATPVIGGSVPSAKTLFLSAAMVIGPLSVSETDRARKRKKLTRIL
ncbi:MAG: hypothetical protein O6909_07345, partial [Alphaproteobacteria bacterium]|nr:hypothetical protein [Alphaproteobacteria bacterium]